MYIPSFNNVDDKAQIREMVARVSSAQFVTVGDDGFPTATMLPILWVDDTVIAHMAKANPHWQRLAPDSPALLICSGPDAYISPTWYAAKYEHGRVVPTWNYSAVHLYATARVHQDPGWLRDAVERLTERHEHARPNPWRVTDAPGRYIDGQLKGIVGIELTVQRVEAKAKLSQNRSAADRRGVIDGLRTEHSGMGARAVAEEMTALEATR